MLKFHPRPERVYVILDNVEEKKIGHIIVQDMHHALTRIGTVQEVGAGVDLKPGDRILISFLSGVVIDMPELYRDGGQDIHRMLTPQEILATVEE